MPGSLLTTPYANISSWADMLLTTHVQGKDEVLYVKKILCNNEENETIPKIPADAAKISNFPMYIIQIYSN
jgi:hypothetical protein